MQNLLLKTLSPQATKVYSLLLKHQNLTAKEIGKFLNIVENTVYRDLKELTQMGIVSKSDDYPTKYFAKPAPEALGFFGSIIRQNFFEAFGLSGKEDDNLKIKFFQTREELLKLNIQDINKTKKYMNVIISGHQVPPEMMLAYKKATERGVRVRKLMQHLNKESLQVARAWQKVGVEIRVTNLINARIVTFDGEFAYFGSYDPGRQQESVGVKFNYPPLARLMDEMFEQKWQKAKII